MQDVFQTKIIPNFLCIVIESLRVRIPRLHRLIKIVLAGQLHDGALLCACIALVGMKRQLPELPDWVRSLCTAPAGSVTFLALHLLEGVFTPSHKSVDFRPFVPSDCIFSSEAIEPIRHAYVFHLLPELTPERLLLLFVSSSVWSLRSGMLYPALNPYIRKWVRHM